VEKLLTFQLKWVRPIYMSKQIFCWIKTCTLIQKSFWYSFELVTFSLAVHTGRW